MDMGLSLLFQTSKPLKFWYETFAIIVYLINRLPTLIIQNKNPLEKLFGLQPNYLSLKNLGCKCFPNL